MEKEYEQHENRADRESERLSRREYLIALKQWSKVVIGAVALGVTTGACATAWRNNGWNNRGTAWGNSGGGSWKNGAGGWKNGGNAWKNGSGGGSWANKRS